jgi:cytochrome bd-type quinol oxidase subunit 2
MKLRFSRLSVFAMGAAVVVMLLSATAVFAQDSSSSDGTLPTLFAGGMLLFILVLAAACYVYFALALSTIATKTNTENPWLAWIPIANVVLMLNIAKKPVWWIILFLIPFVSIVIAIIVWMGVAEARGKPNWWGILLIVPVAGLIVPGYLAWAD